MKKTVSIILSLLMIMSVFSAEVAAQDSDHIKDETMLIIPVTGTRSPTDEEITDIFEKMGVSTWGSGYFGCHMMNPEGDPAPEGVIHQYTQTAGLLDGYEVQWEETNEWGTFPVYGYELPYEKYIEIIDSVFVNHSDMKSFLNNEWSHMYDESTGMVKWATGGFGGPTAWVVNEIYRQSDSLIYATGLMVEYGYEDSEFDGLEENTDYVYITKYGDTFKAMISQPILLTLKKEDGKWKILEYRENMYHIADDKLYDLLEGTVFNRLTVEKTGANVYEDESSKDFTTGFYANGSKWYLDGQRISFVITEKAGYEIIKVVLEDKNGKKEVDDKDGIYTVSPEGTAVLTVETEKIPVEIEIVKPEDNEEIKVSEENTDIFTVAGKTVEELNSAISENTEILNADGSKAEAEDKIASGMKLVIKDEDGEIIDTKTVVVPGDVDGDASITASDARSALRASVGLDKLSDWAQSASDVDGGNKLEANDARSILRAAVGLDDSKEWLAKLV